jgi:hypothetical protein
MFGVLCRPCCALGTYPIASRFRISTMICISHCKPPLNIPRTRQHPSRQARPIRIVYMVFPLPARRITAGGCYLEFEAYMGCLIAPRYRIDANASRCFPSLITPHQLIAHVEANPSRQYSQSDRVACHHPGNCQLAITTYISSCRWNIPMKLF